MARCARTRDSSTQRGEADRVGLVNPCREQAASEVAGVPDGLGPHLAHEDTHAWELAYIEWQREPATPEPVEEQADPGPAARTGAARCS